MKTQRNDVPRPTEAVLAPWSVPQVRAIIAWMKESPKRVPRCPRHDGVRPELVIRFEGFACEEEGCAFLQTWAVPAALGEALQETREEMQARVDDWNAEWPDGTPVDYEPHDPEQRVMKKHTRSRAFIDAKLGPSVRLYGMGPVPLGHVTPCPRRKPRLVEQECERIRD